MYSLFETSLRKMNIEATLVALALVLAGIAGLLYADAAATPTLNQTINAGTLATDIRDASRVTVGSPSVAMSAATLSFSCLTGGSRPSGTLGSDSQRVYVDNPDNADNGWTLAIAATSGATAVWTDGGSNTYDFNDAGGSGCTDGADADLVGGQMTIDPASATTTTDYSGSSTTGITLLGSATAFVQATTDSITLVTAANTSADIWRGYFKSYTIYNTIPAEQAAAAYTLGFTITVSAS